MADGDRDTFLFATFPDGFKWGTATASYQIEGAWNEDGEKKKERKRKLGIFWQMSSCVLKDLEVFPSVTDCIIIIRCRCSITAISTKM